MAKMTNAQLAAENAQLRAAIEELRVENAMLIDCAADNDDLRAEVKALRVENFVLNAEFAQLEAERDALRETQAQHRAAAPAWQSNAQRMRDEWAAAVAQGKTPLKFVGGVLECAQ